MSNYQYPQYPQKKPPKKGVGRTIRIVFVSAVGFVLFWSFVIGMLSRCSTSPDVVLDTSGTSSMSATITTEPTPEPPTPTPEPTKSPEELMAEYIESAVTLDYKQLERNPDEYEGQVVRVKCKVKQLVEGWFSSDPDYRVDESGTSNTWYVTYKLPEGSSRILEGDTVTFIGEFKGLTKVTMVLGNSMQVPKLEAKYCITD